MLRGSSPRPLPTAAAAAPPSTSTVRGTGSSARARRSRTMTGTSSGRSRGTGLPAGQTTKQLAEALLAPAARGLWARAAPWAGAGRWTRRGGKVAWRGPSVWRARTCTLLESSGVGSIALQLSYLPSRDADGVSVWGRTSRRRGLLHLPDRLVVTVIPLAIDELVPWRKTGRPSSHCNHLEGHGGQDQ